MADWVAGHVDVILTCRFECVVSNVNDACAADCVVSNTQRLSRKLPVRGDVQAQ